MPKRSLEGKRCLVTGASSGIGFELALQLAANGAHVIGTARRATKLQDLVAEAKSSPGRIHVFAGDIGKSDFRQELLENIESVFGELDILCNNAGVGAFGPGLTTELATTEKIFQVNVLAPIDLTRLCLPLLGKGNQPLAVFIGSVLGNFPVPLKSDYCATKFALRGWVEAVRAEARQAGIEMLLLNPSTTDSEFFENALDDSTGLNWRRFGSMPPSKVAQKTIEAIRKNRPRQTLTLAGKALSFAYGIAPRLMGHILSRDAKHLD